MTPPTSLARLRLALLSLGALGLVSAALAVALRDELVRSWAAARPDRLEALERGDVTAPAFVPVALVLCVVLLALLWVLGAFVRLGYGWARLVLSLLLVFMAVATVAGVRTAPPAAFVVLAVISFVLEVAVAAALWHPDTSAWLARLSRSTPVGRPG